jgi:hypothetical protein
MPTGAAKGKKKEPEKDKKDNTKKDDEKLHEHLERSGYWILNKLSDMFDFFASAPWVRGSGKK